MTAMLWSCSFGPKKCDLGPPNECALPACEAVPLKEARPQVTRSQHVTHAAGSFLMAEMICDCLADYGMEPVGPAATFEKALMLIKGGNVDAALLDIRLLDGEPVFSVCEPLTAQHIPFAFVSGMVEELPESFRIRDVHNMTGCLDP